MIAIRPAVADDTPLILALAHELAAYEREPDGVTATLPMLEEALFGAKPLAEAVIAELDGVPVGFALCFQNFSTWTGRPSLYLEDLFVREAARGKGVGKALLSHLAALALERNCTRFEWSVLDWNEPAIAFYRTMGAEPMDQWTVQRVSGDALLRLAGRD